MREHHSPALPMSRRDGCPTSPPRRTPVLGSFPAGAATSFLWLEATAWWSWSDSNQPPKCYGTWLVSDQLPWSDTHPDRRAFVVFRDYPGSWSDSNEQPDFKESGSSPTSPPRRTLFISVRLCGNDILLGLPLPLFSGPKIPFPGNREAGLRRPRGPRLRCAEPVWRNSCGRTPSGASRRALRGR